MKTPQPDAGPVPEDNLPGHHPDADQDRPDLDAMAERLGTVPPADRADQDADPSVAERVEATVGAGVMVATAVARAGLGIAGTVVSSLGQQVGRRLGVSR